ncbi:hypothetical protein QYZ88_007730 [Lachnospiraceae bacterium C1.1]|nr:hypothetical protein [Lachnospiraceae bacterium C1.1]
MSEIKDCVFENAQGKEQNEKQDNSAKDRLEIIIDLLKNIEERVDKIEKRISNIEVYVEKEREREKRRIQSRKQKRRNLSDDDMWDWWEKYKLRNGIDENKEIDVDKVLKNIKGNVFDRMESLKKRRMKTNNNESEEKSNFDKYEEDDFLD